MNRFEGKARAGGVLGLRAGDWAEVRSVNEVLATLDERGCLDKLPFMPEMLQYCGKRFRVYKSAHKTCDTISTYEIQRMENAVHLEGLRCDGSAHAGCQAGCLLFWKEAWLKRVSAPDSAEAADPHARERGPEPLGAGAGCSLEDLTRATRATAPEKEDSEERYRCQATELLRATRWIRWWDPRPFVKDLTSGNVALREFVRYLTVAVFNFLARMMHVRTYPHIRGMVVGKTPEAALNLRPGDLVQVRSKEEIRHTIDANQKNRGLSFDVEMVRYCGKTFRVLSRVDRIVDDKTGKLIRMSRGCIILDGVICNGCLSKHRLFCPRSLYPFWREIWLKRVE